MKNKNQIFADNKYRILYDTIVQFPVRIMNKTKSLGNT